VQLRLHRVTRRLQPVEVVQLVLARAAQLLHRLLKETCRVVDLLDFLAQLSSLLRGVLGGLAALLLLLAKTTLGSSSTLSLKRLHLTVHGRHLPLRHRDTSAGSVVTNLPGNALTPRRKSTRQAPGSVTRNGAQHTVCVLCQFHEFAHCRIRVNSDTNRLSKHLIKASNELLK